MNDLETEVRSILSDLADGAPPSTGLVDALHARGRRARHRRLAVAAAAAAVAVLAAGTVAVALREPDATLQVAAPAEPHSGLPPAPVHLGKLPSGFSRPRVSVFDTGKWRIWTTRQKPDAELDISIGPTKPQAHDWPGVESETVTLDGRPATLTTGPVNQGDSMASLSFQRKPDQWIVVSVITKSSRAPFKVVSKAELRAIATGLTDEPTPVPELLRIGSVPDPLEICASHDGSGSGQQYDTSQVALCDPRRKTLPVELNGTLPAVPDNAAVQLYWQHDEGEWWRDQKSGTHRTPIKVGGREGEVAEAGSASQRLWYGWIRLANGVVVNIEMREPNLFTRSQLIEFLGSITPGHALK